MTSKHSRTLIGLASSIALVTGGIALSSTAANAVPAIDQCPAVFPASDLIAGQPVSGLTTTTDTQPEQFAGEYVSKLTDGIGPDKDLLVFKMSGSRITHNDGTVDAGIWAGMSGSPVYANDGRLIGAVSYGFSYESSEYAGVTPAQYMYDLRSFPASSSATTLSSPKSVRLSKSLQSTVVKDGVSSQAASNGLRRLEPTRIVVGPGLQAGAAKAFAKKARFGFDGYRAGSGSSSAAPSYPITAGGNFASTASYGDITLGGIGTATAVCGTNADEVLAYGHPSAFTGKSKEAIHGASAAFIQRDNSGGSYKLANIGAPAGALLQDRLQGILGKIGVEAPTVTVESDTKAYGQTRHGVSHVSVPEALSYVTAVQAYTDTVIGLNQDAGGEALVTWSIDFKRKNGESQTFSRTQRYSSQQELSYDVPNDVASDVETISDNGMERVSITAVHINSRLVPDYRLFKVGKVEFRRNHAWHTVGNGGSINTTPGSLLTLRLTFRAGDTKTDVAPVMKNVTFKISPGAAKTGAIDFTGGMFSYDEDEYFDEDLGEYVDEFEPESLDELLDELKATTRQDDVTTLMTYKTKGGNTGERDGKIRAPGVVTG
ncbi:MAG: hypothetical protein ABIR57_01255, partial [Aeromicrobium sp.]